MLGISGPQYAVWVLSILSEGWLFALLIGRRRARKFPCFSLFIGYCLVRSLVLFALACYQRSETYFYVYYAGILFEAAIMASVCGEVTKKVFHPWYSIPLSSKRLFTYTFVVFLLFSCVAVGLAPDHPVAVMALGRGIERGITIITFGWFSCLALLSTYLRLPWRRHSYGIGAGFILNLSVQSVTLTMISGYGWVVGSALRYVLMFGFLLAEIAWLTYFWNPEPDLRIVTKTELERVAGFLEKFDSVLKQRCLLKEIPQGNGLTVKLFPRNTNGPSIERTKCERLARSGND